uniref:Uncharacterized protein n=1 Tax=Opuntia streptacantha TaxID=393608 RepID=A0A7C9ANP7_OPUST
MVNLNQGCGGRTILATNKPMSEPEIVARTTLNGMNHHSIIFSRVIDFPSSANIKQGSSRAKTNPLSNLRPFGGRMLMYLVAMRKPRKQTVKTLAMGRIAILMVDRRD